MRTIPVLALATLVAVAGSACGAAAPGASSGADPATLTVWQMGAGSPEQTKFLDDVETEFHQRHPGTHVVVKYVPWAQASTAFQKAASGGDGPDVTEIGNTDVQSHIEQGNLADLSDKLKSWPDAKELNKGALANDQSGGKTYAVPWYGGVRGVWYRKDWFADLHIPIPASWDDLRAAAKKIQDAKGVPGIGAPSDQTNAILSLVWANGGDVAVRNGNRWTGTLSQPAAAEAVRFYAGLVSTDRVAPDKYVGKNELEGPQQDFALGQLGMYVDGSWALPQLAKINPDTGRWGTFPLPGKSGGLAPVFSGGSDLAVWQSSKAKDVAFDYLTVLDSKRNAQLFADTLKYLPQFTDLLRGAHYQSDPLLAAFATAAAGDVRFTPTSKGWADYESAKKVLPNAVKDIMLGKPADAVLRAADDQANALLNP